MEEKVWHSTRDSRCKSSVISWPPRFEGLFHVGGLKLAEESYLGGILPFELDTMVPLWSPSGVLLFTGTPHTLDYALTSAPLYVEQRVRL